ncbi:MAG: membrane protein insertase YidC [Myxococcota bacterium]|nr:membrane protein insertase YidC [Myxococcota bacterium]
MINNEESEQNVIRAVLMCLIVYLLYISFLAPPPTIPPEEPTVAAAESEASSTETSADTSTTAVAEGEVPEPSVLDENGEPLPNAEPPEPAFVEANPWDTDFHSETIQSELNSEGGALNSLQYVDYKASMKTQPIWSFLLGKMRGSEAPWLPYGEDPGPEQILTEDGIFLASGAQWDFEIERYELVEQSDSSATVRRTREDGLQISKTYTWGEAKEILEIDVEFKNVGTSKWSGPVWVGAVDVFTGSAGRYSSVARPAIVADETLTSLDDIEDVESSTESVDGSVSWFGIQDTYFMAAAIPQTPNWGRGLFASVENGDPEKSAAGAFLVKDNLTLSAQESDSLRLQVFMGSKDLSVLSEYGNSLSESVSFGIFGFFSHILLKIMVFFQGFVGNWGVAIICLTLTMKTLFFPLTKKSFVSGRKMQALAPKMKELKERYKDNPQQLGQAQMKMFREEGVNPLAGCLPMLVQMPVWFALYSVLLSAAPLYQAEFLFIDDLTSRDPYGVLPTLVGVAMFVQQRITPMSPNADPLQQKIFRMLPFFFVFIMYAFPSGLSLYILVNTLFSIGQMAAVNKAYPMPETAPAKA